MGLTGGSKDKGTPYTGIGVPGGSQDEGVPCIGILGTKCKEMEVSGGSQNEGTPYTGIGVSGGSQNEGTPCTGSGGSQGRGTQCKAIGVPGVIQCAGSCVCRGAKCTQMGLPGGTQSPRMGVSGRIQYAGRGVSGRTHYTVTGVSEATQNGVTLLPCLGAEREVIHCKGTGVSRGTEKEVSVASGLRTPRRTLHRGAQEAGHGSPKLSAQSVIHRKSRESPEEGEGQGTGGAPASIHGIPSIRPEQKEVNGKGDPMQEKRVPQKRSESRGHRRMVTVDSSKAKTSLEALKISIKQLHWKEFPLGRRLPCDIYWHGVSFNESNNISSGQVNKFPGMADMVRKINLSRALRTMQELFPEEYNFYPQSWILPDEYHVFSAQVRMAKENDPSWKPTFIVKPDGGCQGDGIYLIKDPSEVRILGSIQNRPSVVQEYIGKPLLIDKLKFDMRLYVVLKALEPLEIYIAKEGLSRFCTEPYQEPNNKNLHHVYMHLTNYSLNIHSGNFVHSESVHTGSKRTFSSVLYRLSAKGVDVKKVWSDIVSLVIKTIIALVPELKVYYQADIPPGKPGPTCFQILGFDILLLRNLKPVLLEVNANPSMKIEHEQELLPGVFQNVPSPVDEEVKIAVIRDTLRLVDPLRRRRSQSCKLSGGSFSMASGDILYIDITRRWSSMALDQRESGMCLQAFIDAFICLAQRRYKGLPLHEQVQALADLCQSHVDTTAEKKILCTRGMAERRTALSSYRHPDVHLTSYTPLLHRASCKLSDYKLQHS
ncbi:tubulin polyglutamylase TTLL11 isoform X2 [Hyperolius riggenbachi]|uniref:tubulin polyglutamylase TTLL11 isoform X2 n=1 Tax=Hyperolius riggenbachi TaxID=752182 RepID=UPI0035A2C6B5